LDGGTLSGSKVVAKPADLRVPLLPISLRNYGFRSSAHAAEGASPSPGLAEKRPWLTRLQQIGGALHPAAAAIQHVCVAGPDPPCGGRAPGRAAAGPRPSDAERQRALDPRALAARRGAGGPAPGAVGDAVGERAAVGAVAPLDGADDADELDLEVVGAGADDGLTVAADVGEGEVRRDLGVARL
jgi:hypothetical protein